MELKDLFIINVLRNFDFFLVKEKYLLKKLIYSPIVDDPCEIYYESLDSHSTGINFIFHSYPSKNISPVAIDISRPKSNLLNALGVKYSGYGYDERKHILTEEFIKQKKKRNSFKIGKLDEGSITSFLLENKIIFEQHLLPVIRGEKWIDEIVAEHKSKAP